MNEEEVFARVLEVAPGMRAMFLKQACGNDEELRGRVAALLEMHEGEDDLLDGPLDVSLGEVIRESAEASFPPVEEKAGEGDAQAFGGYILEEKIAKGAMGAIYRARQPTLRRTVALKMIRSGILVDQRAVKRFAVEVRAMAKLDHPNIVPIYEAGEIEGQPFFSMQLIKGTTLEERIDSFRGKPEEAVKLVITLAGALEAAHAQGILHRDLKPSNVLIDEKGTAFVTDFGLAKDVAGNGGLTMQGQVLGTPTYMAPEQAKGEIDRIGPATDVYGLGAIFYQLLTGRPPHAAKDLKEMLYHVAESEPVAPRRIERSIDRDLEEIVMICLAKDGRERYASMAELSEALEGWLRNDWNPGRNLWKWVRRHPGAAVSLLLVEVVLLAGLVWGWLWVRRMLEGI